MPSTLNPTCPLCGLRFENKPLLDLHMREDHRKRVFRARNGDGDPGDARPPAAGADSPPGSHDQAAAPSQASKEATAKPARRGRVGWATTALRGARIALRRALHGTSTAGACDQFYQAAGHGLAAGCPRQLHPMWGTRISARWSSVGFVSGPAASSGT